MGSPNAQMSGEKLKFKDNVKLELFFLILIRSYCAARLRKKMTEFAKVKKIPFPEASNYFSPQYSVYFC